jgi:hypothetical protein
LHPVTKTTRSNRQHKIFVLASEVRSIWLRHGLGELQVPAEAVGSEGGLGQPDPDLCTDPEA